MSFSSEILTSNSGLITVEVPRVGGSRTNVTGILQDDLQIRMGNNFSPISEISSALDTLQELQQVIKTESITNYVPASGLAWKGTPHIEVSANFYLITCNAHSNIRGDAKALASLCTVYEAGALSSKIHGGYQLDYYDDGGSLTNKGYLTNKRDGTVSIVVKGKMIIHGLLCTAFSCQPSTVVCRNGEPLYYNISMSFKGHRAPVTTDLDSMFGG